MKKALILKVILLAGTASFGCNLLAFQNLESVDNTFSKEIIKKAGGHGTDFIYYPSSPGYPPNYSNQLTMANYFSSLVDFFPENRGVTCAYVALSMILSYYDTFKNENVIPESYEDSVPLASTNINASSPGVKHNSSSYSQYNYLNNLDTFVDLTYNELFDSYLIKNYSLYKGAINYLTSLSAYNQAQLLFYFYYSYGIEPLVESFSSIDNFSVYGFEYSSLVGSNMNQQTSNWFYDWLLNETQVNSDALMDDVVSYIHLGIPVILSIYKGYELNPNYLVSGTPYNQCYYLFKDNHSVVAYDTTFVDGVEVPICHFGWDNYSSVLYNTDNYNYIFHYVPVIYNSNQFIHSTNYKIDNLLYCGCGHHTHSLSYSYVDEYKHSISCPCGYLNHENHSDHWYYSCCGGGLDYPPGVLGHDETE